MLARICEFGAPVSSLAIRMLSVATTGAESPELIAKKRPKYNFLLWQVDDSMRWHDVTKKTLHFLPGGNKFELVSFLSGEAVLKHLESYKSEKKPSILRKPDLILMDYYLGKMLGDELTKEIRKVFPKSSGVMIICYSAVMSGNMNIRDAGGDQVIEKHHDNGVNIALASFLAEYKQHKVAEKIHAEFH